MGSMSDVVDLPSEMVAWIESRGMSVPTLETLRRYGHAPGHYSCECVMCHTVFDGVKDAVRCVECASGLHTLTGGAA